MGHSPSAEMAAAERGYWAGRGASATASADWASVLGARSGADGGDWVAGEEVPVAPPAEEEETVKETNKGQGGERDSDCLWVNRVLDIQSNTDAVGAGRDPFLPFYLL